MKKQINSTFSNLNKNRTPTLGYSLGIQSSKTQNVIHQTCREGHTDLNHTIKPSIGCSSEWRNKEIKPAPNWTKIALRHWVIAFDSKKMEGLKTPNVIHQTGREGHTDLNHTIKPCIGCSSEWRNKEIQPEQKSHSDSEEVSHAISPCTSHAYQQVCVY